MYHHSNEDYHIAASQAAKQGRTKMEEIIAKGQANAQAVLEQVQTQVPMDRIVTAKAITVLPNEEPGFNFKLRMKGLTDTLSVHKHAMSQIADKAGIPNNYIDKLIKRDAEYRKNDADPWAQELLAYNINQLFLHSDDRHLVRAIKTTDDLELRGFLSDRYRRLDSRPLLDAFMGGCQKIGAVPVDGYALDTRVRMRAVLPMVFEPVPNEVMLFGIQWGNSDFGNGGHTLSLFNIRVWCTNTGILDEVLRQVHIGKRLDDNIEYSKKTLELDTKANASAVQDMVMNILGPRKIDEYMEHIRIASEEKIDDKDVTRILKTKLTKTELEGVNDLFKGPDVINLPPGKSTYRLSNALSFFAQTEGISRDRQLDLQRFAGELISVREEEAVEV